MGWVLAVAGFVGAMTGVAIMLAGMAAMYFAPVERLAFRWRLKLNLLGVAVLVVSVALMATGVAIELSLAKAAAGAVGTPS